MSETQHDSAQADIAAGGNAAGDGIAAEPSGDRPRGGRSFRFWLYPLLALLFALVLQQRGASSIDWSQDFEASRALAEREGKPMLVAFSSKRCPPCIAMERTVLSKPAVTKALERFVPVKVDVWETPEFAHRYQVQYTPSYGVITPDGKMWAGHPGPADIDEFVAFLDKGYAQVPSSAFHAVASPTVSGSDPSAAPASGSEKAPSAPLSLTAGPDGE